MDDVESRIGVRSIYGAQSRQGLVELTVNGTQVLIPPTKAREAAAMLLESASSAEGDQVLMRVLERAQFSPQRSAQILLAMRQERNLMERAARKETQRAMIEDVEDLDAR